MQACAGFLSFRQSVRLKRNKRRSVGDRPRGNARARKRESETPSDAFFPSFLERRSGYLLQRCKDDIGCPGSFVAERRGHAAVDYSVR